MSASTLDAIATKRSPARVALPELIQLQAAGESLNLAALRVRVVGAGGHVSPFKGRGVEFDESRPYQPGDDLRTMDWRVTARTGKPYTKVFRDERDRPATARQPFKQRIACNREDHEPQAGPAEDDGAAHLLGIQTARPR